MDFRRTRVKSRDGEHFRAFTVDEIELYRPLPSPVYVYLELNEKYVSIKRPFDFFTEADIEQYKGKPLYFHSMMDHADPFIEAAKNVREILEYREGDATQTSMDPPTYEISDELLRSLGTLWTLVDRKHQYGTTKEIAVDTYYATLFTNYACDNIDAERIILSRDTDVDRYELGIIRAGVAVFLALHLSIMDFKILNGLRNRIFLETTRFHSVTSLIPFSPELEELSEWVKTYVFEPGVQILSTDMIRFSSSRVNQKLWSRLQRIQRELLIPDLKIYSSSDELGLGELGNHG